MGGPLSSKKIINCLHHWGPGNPAFCIWAPLLVFSIQGNLCRLYSSKQVIPPPLFIFLSDLFKQWSLRPWRSGCLSLAIHGHIIGTIYNYIGTSSVSHHLPPRKNVRASKFCPPMVSQKTYDKYVNWPDAKRFDRFFIFMMLGLSVQRTAC